MLLIGCPVQQLTGGDPRCDACEYLAEVLTSVSIRDVELVEFYRGVAQIPGDLARDVCAVLGIWTR